MFLTHNNSWNSPMLKSLSFKPLFLNLNQITTIPFKTLKLNSSLSTLCLNHNSSTTSQQTQFKASKLVQFGTPEKFNSVIDIFKIYGFSDTQINQIVKQAPNIVNCDPNKRILPKFEFLSSKGASNSEIVEIVWRSPRILYSSLENNIIPTFELVRRFIPSDKKVIERILRCKFFFGHYNVIKNVNLLLDEGVTDSNIRCLLLKRPSILLSNDMIIRNALNVVKEMGFNDPSNVNFVIALLAIGAMSKSRWDAKVLVFKRWGWSEEMVLEAFRKRALCMLVSVEKINKVMRFWVNELDWNSSALVKRPEIFSYSLENRIIPRASVVSYLISKGLIEKNVELSTPFSVIEKVFLEKYVHCFKEERHDLLKLYQEKMDV
jgi:mTERF domain-containing protein